MCFVVYSIHAFVAYAFFLITLFFLKIQRCEAMGFRRITYYPDRPDNMAVFDSIRLEADKESYPVLLSNGNFVSSGSVEGTNRHFAVWSGEINFCFFIIVQF